MTARIKTAYEAVWDQWLAWDDQLGADTSPIGWGATEAEAIADLGQLLEDAADAQAELTELRLELIAAHGQAADAHDARMKAEADRDALRAALMSIANATFPDAAARFTGIARAALKGATK